MNTPFDLSDIPVSVLETIRDDLKQRIVADLQRWHELRDEVTHRRAQSVGVLSTPDDKISTQTPDVEQA